MTAEEILAKAAELVERPGGWCQGAYVVGGAVCARGAIYAADGAALNNTEMCAHDGSAAVWDATGALSKELDGESVVRWNDTPGRTAEEVATALRNAKRFL